jgi:hypothetical protein
MGLINEQQKKNADVGTSPIDIPIVAPPATEAPEAPAVEPVLQQAPIEAFEQGFAQELEQQANDASLPGADIGNFSKYTDIQGSESEPSMPAPVAPVIPKLDLWEDTTNEIANYGLNDPRTVATKLPTLFGQFQAPTDIAGAQASQLFVDVANRTLIDEQTRVRNEAISRQEAQVARRRALPNTPDIEKPWHEQAWNGIPKFFSEVLFGTEGAKENTTNGRKQFNVLAGAYGVHGAGLGGALKYALSTPLALVNTLGANFSELSLQERQKAYEWGNPVVEYRGKKVPYKSLTTEAKREVAGEANNKLFGQVFPAYNYKYAERNFAKQYLDIINAKKVGDDLNDANPNLKPLPGAVAEPPKGNFYDSSRRPGQPWYQSRGTGWEVANQLLSPGNKIDVAGNAIGAVVGKAVSPIGKILFGGLAEKVRFNADVNAFYKGIEERELVKRALPNLELPKAPDNSLGIPLPPLERQLATPPNALPDVAPPNAGLQLQQGEYVAPPRLVEPKPVYKSPGVALPALPAKLQPPVNKAAQAGFNVAPARQFEAVRGNLFEFKPVVPDNLNVATPIVPKTDASAVVSKVGSLKPGRTIDFVPDSLPRNHDDLISFLRTGTEEQQAFVKDYTGKNWDEWTDYVSKSGKDAGQFGATGELPVLQPSLPKLDDLVRQSTELAAQKNVLELATEQIDEFFEATVDVGRRALDELPVGKTSIEVVENALELGAQPQLTREAIETLPDAAKQALLENNVDELANLADDGVFTREVVEQAVEVSNASLEPRQLVTTYAKTSLAKEVPSEVYHGTALDNWTPDYNVKEFGSRGELGSGLYTTKDLVEATEYARAFVGENVGAAARYAPLQPNVSVLDTSAFKATLDASKRLPASVIDEIRKVAPDFVPPSKQLSYKSLVSAFEKTAASSDSSEQGLQAAGNLLSDALRKSGYDSVYDKKSGWFVALDNGKLKMKRVEQVNAPQNPLEAAIARYNVDTRAAKNYDSHITSASNLADSTYKLLEQTKAQVDEALEEVQARAIEAISKKRLVNPEPLKKANVVKTVVSKGQSKTVTLAVDQIGLFGRPLDVPALTRAPDGSLTVVANSHSWEAMVSAKMPDFDVNVNGRFERLTLADAANVAIAEKQLPAPRTVKAALEELQQTGTLKHLPVYTRTNNGDLFVTNKTDVLAKAAARYDKPVQSVVIEDGVAKLEPILNNRKVVLQPEAPVEPTLKELAAKEAEDSIGKLKVNSNADLSEDEIFDMLKKANDELESLNDGKFDLNSPLDQETQLLRAEEKVAELVEALNKQKQKKVVESNIPKLDEPLKKQKQKKAVESNIPKLDEPDWGEALGKIDDETDTLGVIDAIAADEYKLYNSLYDHTKHAPDVVAKAADLIENAINDELTPLFELRQALPQLSRSQFDAGLYKLSRDERISLNTIQEGANYTPAQQLGGIPQGIGGSLFFATKENGVNFFDEFSGAGVRNTTEVNPKESVKELFDELEPPTNCSY